MSKPSSAYGVPRRSPKFRSRSSGSMARGAPVARWRCSAVVSAPRPGLAVRRHDVAAGVAADVLVHLEAVAGEDRGHGFRELRRARRVVTRADDHLVVFHPPRAPGVAVEEERIAVVPRELGE